MKMNMKHGYQRAKSGLIVCLIAGGITGCATPPHKINAAYVSPVKYEDYTCGQIAREAREVDRQSEYLRKYLRHEATADKWQMGVGLAVIWPALLFLEGGDGPEATSYANLKGEKIALEKIADDKKCGVLYQASRG